MKTVVTELIEVLKKDEINSQYAMERVSIRNCIIFATSLLENEKQQIIEAVTHGNRMEFYDASETGGEQYYTSTFETNK